MFIQLQFAPNPGKQECMLPLFKYTYSYISIPVKWDRGLTSGLITRAPQMYP